MPKFPRITGKEVIKHLAKIGFEVVRIKGSHHFLKHSDGRATVVPVHGKENIGIGLMMKILRDCEMSKEEFLKLLGN